MVDDGYQSHICVLRSGYQGERAVWLGLHYYVSEFG